MYVAALDLSPEDIYAVSLFCFIEMLRAGWTTVGEFHYLHRDERGLAYDDPCELAHRVIAAAETAGIRICLLNVAYVTGAIGEPLRPEQRRFATPDLEDWLTQSAELTHAMLDRPLVTVGLAPHSVRAVPREWLRPAHELAFGYDLPLHTHASEQQAEVAACIAAYGMRPVELLADAGIADELLTVVHATHVTHREIALLARGPTVCACPTTERDLGDGFLPGLELRAAGAPIALGTDSNTIIDPFEEMRLLEYHERLRRQRRIVLGDETKVGERLDVGPALLDIGTKAGARALRVDAGRIEAGALADLVAVDVEHRALAGWTPRTLAATLALAAPADVVTDVWVGGEARVRDRHHPLEMEAAAGLRLASTRLPD
jgi:formimidoylglutamate deiminase